MLHYMTVVSKWFLPFLTSFPCSWLLSVQRTPLNSSECLVFMPIAVTYRNQVLLLTCKHFLSFFSISRATRFRWKSKHSKQEFGLMHEKWAILSLTVVCDTSVLRQGFCTQRCANAVVAIHAFAVHVVVN